MGDRHLDRMGRTMATGITRRIFSWGTGLTLATLAIRQTPGRALAHTASTTTPEEDDLDQAITQMRAATVDFINGKTDAWKAMCSHREDATLFGGWGGHERGWEQLGPRYDWAAARFAGGEVTFEELARYATPDLAVHDPLRADAGAAGRGRGDRPHQAPRQPRLPPRGGWLEAGQPARRPARRDPGAGDGRRSIDSGVMFAGGGSWRRQVIRCRFAQAI